MCVKVAGGAVLGHVFVYVGLLLEAEPEALLCLCLFICRRTSC